MADGAPRSRAEAEPAEGKGEPEADVQMTFFEHLDELRKRVIRSLYGLIVTTIAAWFFKEDLLDILVRPLVAAWHHLGLGEPTLHFANPADPFIAYMKIAMVVGLLGASPWLFWQLWAFISPGLHHKEKRLALPFVVTSTLFFAGGAVFGYLVVFPAGFETFLSLAGMLPSGALRVAPTIMMTEYLDFATQFLVAFGVVFEVPVIVTFLALAGLVDWKQLLRFSRWWIVASSVISAVLTPPDMASQLMMMIPLIVLYFVSVLIAFFVGKKRPAS
jgi:sec-independent protein translocase protein TatC